MATVNAQSADQSDLIIPDEGVYSRITDISVGELVTTPYHVGYRIQFQIEVWNSYNETIELDFLEDNCAVSYDIVENITDFEVLFSEEIDYCVIGDYSQYTDPFDSGITSFNRTGVSFYLFREVTDGNFSTAINPSIVDINLNTHSAFDEIFGQNYGASWIIENNNSQTLELDLLPSDYGKSNSTASNALHVRLVNADISDPIITNDRIGAYIPLEISGELINAGDDITFSTPETCGSMFFGIRNFNLDFEPFSSVDHHVCTTVPNTYHIPHGKYSRTNTGSLGGTVREPNFIFDEQNFTGSLEIFLDLRKTDETAYGVTLEFNQGNLLNITYEPNNIDWSGFAKVSSVQSDQGSQLTLGLHIYFVVMIISYSIYVNKKKK